MKYRTVRAVAALVLAMALLPLPALAQAGAPQPPADAEVVVVVDVIDGDTIRVERLNGEVERVRYIGIDTPEVARDDQVAEPWADTATEVNAELVADEFVTLERDVSDRDHYERLLRYVWVHEPDGWLMVNAELVAQGLAEVHAYEPDTQYDGYLSAIEDEARAAGLGIHGGGDAAESDEDDGGLIEQFLDLIGWD